MTYKIFAQTYNCDVYNHSAAFGTCPTAPASSSDPLANTGYDVLLPIFLGVSIFIASLIFMAKQLWRKHRASKNSPSVLIEE